MTILIFGGAGFIGSNVANHFIQKNERVCVFDNLSRDGSKLNLKWLKQTQPFDFMQSDIRNFDQVREFISSYPDARAILHLAAQVAVTTSVQNPRDDFESNALGTFNILEAVRLNRKNYNVLPLLIYASTNKVYGNLSHHDILETKDRYQFSALPHGICEEEPLDFHSPYGCSKGAADQYVLDYARIYGLPTTAFRQSCIYGYRQFGVEDQGWVAWFTIASVLNKPITLFGSGKQVRDILFIDDLIDCYEKAIDNPGSVMGKAFNIGGGPKNTLSLLELIANLEKILGKKMNAAYSNWRSGDQKIFVSDIRKIENALHWTPKISIQIGLQKIYQWINENKTLFV